ncbi:MAG: hypothetical protein NZ480_01200 [Bdellovibrionaceae bacterium]|nr:hypothetical protein [Pseudobdellovibrionaceae bacterium]MDW8189780.1 hypothetical protein [Pseudobdellovibrionaceae bacterium]
MKGSHFRHFYLYLLVFVLIIFNRPIHSLAHVFPQSCDRIFSKLHVGVNVPTASTDSRDRFPSFLERLGRKSQWIKRWKAYHEYADAIRSNDVKRLKTILITLLKEHLAFTKNRLLSERPFDLGLYFEFRDRRMAQALLDLVKPRMEHILRSDDIPAIYTGWIQLNDLLSQVTYREVIRGYVHLESQIEGERVTELLKDLKHGIVVIPFIEGNLREIEVLMLMAYGNMPLGMIQEANIFVDGVLLSRKGFYLHDVTHALAHFRQVSKEDMEILLNFTRYLVGRYFQYDIPHAREALELIHFLILHEIPPDYLLLPILEYGLAGNPRPIEANARIKHQLLKELKFFLSNQIADAGELADIGYFADRELELLVMQYQEIVTDWAFQYY